MSKLSGPLKALINAPHARPGPTASSKKVAAVYNAIAHDAAARGVGLPAWLTISTAATMTMNSPDSLLELHRLATATATATASSLSSLSSSSSSSSPSDNEDHQAAQRSGVYAAELMREVGLKCISFNGIPRSINCLGAFYTSLPASISSALSTKPTRTLTERNLSARLGRGLALWKSIYAPLDAKLMAKLGRSHPDLPVVIHQAHYAALLANPPPPRSPGGSASAEALGTDGQQQPGQRVGRVLTSLTGIACLRAQTGVGPQVLSHIFGLRKAYGKADKAAAAASDDGEQEQEQEQTERVEGGEWLATDEGSIWLLEVVDRIVDAIGDGKGTSFAPARALKAKL